MQGNLHARFGRGELETYYGDVARRWLPTSPSNLAAEGADQREIDAILGHRTEKMRLRYQHLFARKLTEAMSKLPSAI